MILQGELPVTNDEADGLWEAVRLARSFKDDDIAVKVVSEDEIRELNKKYRGRDKATNVLTFNYEDEHDVILCLTVAKREAGDQGVDIRGYVAWLLVHAFLHATGMDHEKSEAEARDMRKLEKDLLLKSGFEVYTY